MTKPAGVFLQIVGVGVGLLGLGALSQNVAMGVAVTGIGLVLLYLGGLPARR